MIDKPSIKLYLLYLWNKLYVDAIIIAIVNEVFGFAFADLAHFIDRFCLTRFLLFGLLLVF